MADVHVVTDNRIPGVPPSALSELAHEGRAVTLHGRAPRVLYRLPSSNASIRKTLTPVLRALRRGPRAGGRRARLHLPEMIDPHAVYALAQTAVLAGAAPFRAAPARRARPRPPASAAEDEEDDATPLALEVRYTEANQVAVGRRAGVLAHASLLARHLATERLDPAGFERRVAQVFAPLGGAVRLGVVRDPAARGMGLMAAVGQGAASPPRLLVVEYAGGGPGAGGAPAVVVGKGITFDTGGLNIKPTRHIETMYLDKGGAAAAAGAVWALAQLRAPARVVALLAMAENAIGSRAVKPGALLTALDGTTVEVDNTDAEGRLVMADTIVWGTRRYAPHTIVDIATLTGSCVAALGEHTAGLFRNTRGKKAARALQRAGRTCGEEVWPMPIQPEHREAIRGDHAQINNSGHGHGGGASTAAAFLEHFVDPAVAWVHLDIAGPGMLSKPHGYLPRGGTGFGAQLLAEYFIESGG